MLLLRRSLERFLLFALYNEQILPLYEILEGLLVSVVVECVSKVVANVLNNVL